MAKQEHRQQPRYGKQPQRLVQKQKERETQVISAQEILTYVYYGWVEANHRAEAAQSEMNFVYEDGVRGAYGLILKRYFDLWIHVPEERAEIEKLLKIYQ